MSDKVGNQNVGFLMTQFKFDQSSLYPQNETLDQKNSVFTGHTVILGVHLSCSGAGGNYYKNNLRMT